MTVKRFFISLTCMVLLSPLAAETCLSQSAWQELVRQNPAVVDDPSVDWRERLILDALTPEQARRYYRGTSAEDLVVRDGQTLAEYLAARMNPPGNVYVPLPGPCEVFRVEDLLVDESLSVQVRGRCGIPEEATAVILQVKAESMGGYPRVKMWASDLPEPAEAVVEGSNASFGDLNGMTAVVTLCGGAGCRGGELHIRGTETGMVQAEAVGYFRPLSSTDGAGRGGGIQFYTESSQNNFFGTGAGAANTTGYFNAFFGGYAGTANTTGNFNTFFGRDAGRFNTTGSNNAFFGRSAGFFSTTGHDNAFFGYMAGYSNTEGDYNAFVGYQSGSSNTTGDSNSFFGYQAGNSNINGIGNSFLGTNAGNSNTTGTANSFFGGGAGFSNTSGFYNSFFGWSAGYSNTTGENNAFFGRSAGFSNTVENYNTFVGYLSDLDPGPDPGTSPVTNATAVGFRSYVSQSNSLVLGSINGVNGATANTQVGIGTTAPERLLHITGDNAVFRMDRSADSAAFMLVRTDGGGSVLKNFVIGVNASGTDQGEFIINDLGTALGGPGERRLTINNDGDVIINGDLITNAGPLSFPDYVFAKDYELMPLGELSEYVETEKHLPEIPSAGEIQEQGKINVTELQLKLLQKIEELTLYTIEQQAINDLQHAMIDQQHAEIEQLKEQNRLVNELRSRLETLEKAVMAKP